MANLTLDKESKIQEQRLAFFKKLGNFRKSQDVYMPGVKTLIRTVEAERDIDAPAPLAEDVKLWLPSDVPAHHKVTVAADGLYEGELRLHQGQCSDALAQLRNKLLTKRFLISFRNTNIVGQHMSTRARSLIASVGDGVQTAARKYRQAREALVALGGEEKCGDFRVLLDEDLVLSEEVEADAVAMKQLSRLGRRDSWVTTGRMGGTKKHVYISQKGKTMSWIWTAMGGP